MLGSKYIGAFKAVNASELHLDRILPDPAILVIRKRISGI